MITNWLSTPAGLEEELFRAHPACPRRLRLAACAAVRAVGAGLAPRGWADLVAVAEQVADGAATDADRASAGRFDAEVSTGPLHWRRTSELFGGGGDAVQLLARGLAHLVTVPFDWRNAAEAVRLTVDAAAVRGLAAAGEFAAAAVSDVFTSPYDPVPFSPTWRAPDAVAVARHVYDDRAFHDLPILADALQDAGCADERVLGHCRAGGVHYRGCWVVDAALDKLPPDPPPHVPKKRRK